MRTSRKIGLAVANLQADFFNQIKQSVEAEAAKKGIEVVTVDARGDAATQVNQIQDFVTQKVDALIYIPAGATAAGVPVKDAKAAGIPVINVDRNPPDAPGDTFIASDSVAAAKTVGEHIAKQTGGKGKMVIIHGQNGTTPEVDRNKGFEEALHENPGLKVVAKQSADWDQDEGFNHRAEHAAGAPGHLGRLRPGRRAGARRGAGRARAPTSATRSGSSASTATSPRSRPSATARSTPR